VVKINQIPKDNSPVPTIKTQTEVGRPEVMTENLCRTIAMLRTDYHLPVAQVCRIVGIARQTYYRALNSGKFDKYFSAKPGTGS